MERSSPERVILGLNSGSSSLKFALYEGECLLARGALEGVGEMDGRFWIDAEKTKFRKQLILRDHREAVEQLQLLLHRLRLPQPQAISHRIVHGGRHYTQPTLIDDSLLRLLKELIPFAPLHLPAQLLCIESMGHSFLQVACFDTAFHRTMPELARRFPLLESFWDEGIERYGFHGLSYEYILHAYPEASRGRVIIAHLGNGVSLAAVREGAPKETTMGFTPTGGVMMGTRTGDLDPGLLLYLLEQKNHTPESLNTLVNRQSGLLGVSGLTANMETLLADREKNAKAQLAIDLFCYGIAKAIASLTVSLQGVDRLIFTGGIGEHAPLIRQKICEPLSHLGLFLDPACNERGSEVISTTTSPCQILVCPTNEEKMLVLHAQTVVFGTRVP